MTDNTNPGNFANRSKEEVQNIASKGGQTGTENKGFASMPTEQVVSSPLHADPDINTKISHSKKLRPKVDRRLAVHLSQVVRRRRKLDVRVDQLEVGGFISIQFVMRRGCEGRSHSGKGELGGCTCA